MSAAVIEHLHIVGGGLIGSSIARAARKYGAANRITLSDADTAVCARASALQLADHITPDGTKDASEADLVILCVPVGAMGQAAETLVPGMKPGAILSDVGSVKSRVRELASPFVPGGVHFIPAHPIAGTEHSGPDAGFATLFQDRWCILTPDKKTDKAALETYTAFWSRLGSDVTHMSDSHHDRVLATTSHVPHMIAYALVGTAIDMEEVTRGEVVKFSAGGFRDFTRIAASDPVMWRDVFLNNKTAVLEILDRYIEDLTALKRNVRWSQGDKLLEKFTKTRDIRRRIIDAGQDTDGPDFGRPHPED